MKNGQRAFLEQLGLERQSTHSALPRVIGHNRVNSTHWSMETSPSVPFPFQAKQSKSKDQVNFAFRSPLSSAWSLSPLQSMITGIRRLSLKHAITASNQLKASKLEQEVGIFLFEQALTSVPLATSNRHPFWHNQRQ
ncbi:unnamed protein product [Ilex paraguariensis]|uniref:Uncharacterized protein n=1 Tax=Ilex paraguariensis TaxID=185542 RepID=A0ABC8TFZ4_9AQUA